MTAPAASPGQEAPQGESCAQVCWRSECRAGCYYPTRRLERPANDKTRVADQPPREAPQADGNVCPGCGGRFGWVDVQFETGPNRVWMTPAGCTFGECYWKGPLGGEQPEEAPQAEGLSAEERRSLGCTCVRLDDVWHHVRGCSVPAVERVLADRLAAQARDHEAEVERRPAAQREDIAAAFSGDEYEENAAAAAGEGEWSWWRWLVLNAPARAYRGDS